MERKEGVAVGTGNGCHSNKRTALLPGCAHLTVWLEWGRGWGPKELLKVKNTSAHTHTSLCGPGVACWGHIFPFSSAEGLPATDPRASDRLPLFSALEKSLSLEKYKWLGYLLGMSEGGKATSKC